MENKRALIVNDSRFEARILKDMLSKLNFTVMVTDEFDALKKVEEIKPHFLITNYIMETMTGDQMISKIKAIHPECYCVLTSSSDIGHDRNIMAHVDSFLYTGITMDMMASEVEKALQVKVTQPLFCTACGEKLIGQNEKARFCPNCGNKLF